MVFLLSRTAFLTGAGSSWATVASKAAGFRFFDCPWHSPAAAQASATCTHTGQAIKTYAPQAISNPLCNIYGP